MQDDEDVDVWDDLPWPDAIAAAARQLAQEEEGRESFIDRQRHAEDVERWEQEHRSRMANLRAASTGDLLRQLDGMRASFLDSCNRVESLARGMLKAYRESRYDDGDWEAIFFAPLKDHLRREGGYLEELETVARERGVPLTAVRGGAIGNATGSTDLTAPKQEDTGVDSRTIH
jgi:hypothetical protein